MEDEPRRDRGGAGQTCSGRSATFWRPLRPGARGGAPRAGGARPARRGTAPRRRPRSTPRSGRCPELRRPSRRRAGPLRRRSSAAAATPLAATSQEARAAAPAGVACPLCHEGQVVERRAAERVFFGCSRYPACRFTSSYRPLAESCPECGRAYLFEKQTKRDGRVVFCGNETLSLPAQPVSAARSQPCRQRPECDPARVAILPFDGPSRDDRRRRPRRLRGRLAARAPRRRRRPVRDAPGAEDAGAPDGRPRRARLLQQPARQRARPGRRACSRRRCAGSARSSSRVADAVQVPAGSALAVDRGLFARRMTEAIEALPLVHAPPRGAASHPRRPGHDRRDRAAHLRPARRRRWPPSWARRTSTSTTR